MGDNFFKIFFGSLFALLVLIGALMVYTMSKQTADERQIRDYVESRGKKPVPRAWQSKIGDGI